MTIAITVDDAHTVSGLLQMPADATACLALAHGAGAGMAHAFMAAVAEGLCARSIGMLRYQFPYMEQGSKRPDRPALAHATVRAAVQAAAQLAPGLPLFAGGKSFGGRMTSQAQAEAALPGVRGLVFFGFPLHPAGRPSIQRADHLAAVALPMLFLQGTRDALADLNLLAPGVAALGPTASLAAIEGADHSFHVAARGGRRDADVLGGALDGLAEWIKRILSACPCLSNHSTCEIAAQT